MIASTKELYTEKSEAVEDEKESMGENQESVHTEKELAEMQYQEQDAQIQAELDTLQAREAELQEELKEIQEGIAALEAQRAEAASARDGTIEKVQQAEGKIGMTGMQLATSEEAVALELEGVEVVEKVLDDTFFEIGKDVTELVAVVASSSVQLETASLQILSEHIGFVSQVLQAFQQKIGFCASELNERIEKRESMIKLGMENVADSLIPGFAHPAAPTASCYSRDLAHSAIEHPTVTICAADRETDPHVCRFGPRIAKLTLMCVAPCLKVRQARGEVCGARLRDEDGRDRLCRRPSAGRGGDRQRGCQRSQQRSGQRHPREPCRSGLPAECARDRGEQPGGQDRNGGSQVARRGRLPVEVSDSVPRLVLNQTRGPRILSFGVR